MADTPAITTCSFPSDVFTRLAQAESGFWWFQSRNELILWSLKKFSPAFKSLLEIGCGSGFVLQEIGRNYPKAQLTGAEYFEEGLVHARKRVPQAQFEQLDATQMSQREVFDVIGAFDVIEHIKDDCLVLRNLNRALKSGGRLFITVPQHRWLWSTIDEKAGHFRRYSFQELKKKVGEAGFEVEYSTSFVSFLAPLMWLSRLKAPNPDCDPMAEFKIPPFINLLLRAVMKVEFLLIRFGLRVPFGGSRLLVAKAMHHPHTSPQPNRL